MASTFRLCLALAVLVTAAEATAQTLPSRQGTPQRRDPQPSVAAQPAPAPPQLRLDHQPIGQAAMPAPQPKPGAPLDPATTHLSPIGVQVSARASATIAAPMSGQLVALPAHDGDAVKEHDVVARFNCTQQEAVLARAQAELVKRQDILSTQQSLRALNAYSKADFVTAQNDVSLAKAELAVAQTAVDNCVVKAPFSGRVANAPVRNFQFVQAGSPLLDIVDDRDLELEFIVPSVWLVWLKVGAPAQLQISETKEAFVAKITRISGKVDAASQTIKIYGRIAGETSTLLPGMSGLAYFPGSADQPQR